MRIGSERDVREIARMRDRDSREGQTRKIGMEKDGDREKW